MNTQGGTRSSQYYVWYRILTLLEYHFAGNTELERMREECSAHSKASDSAKTALAAEVGCK